jgi:hypothetical protein
MKVAGVLHWQVQVESEVWPGPCRSHLSIITVNPSTGSNCHLREHRIGKETVGVLLIARFT